MTDARRVPSNKNQKGASVGVPRALTLASRPISAWASIVRTIASAAFDGVRADVPNSGVLAHADDVSFLIDEASDPQASGLPG